MMAANKFGRQMRQARGVRADRSSARITIPKAKSPVAALDRTKRKFYFCPSDQIPARSDTGASGARSVFLVLVVLHFVFELQLLQPVVVYLLLLRCDQVVVGRMPAHEESAAKE